MNWRIATRSVVIKEKRTDDYKVNAQSDPAI